LITQPLQVNSSTSQLALGVTHDWLQPVEEVESSTQAVQVFRQLSKEAVSLDVSVSSASVASVLGAGGGW